MAKRKPEYKPLLFTTTVRNPKRIKSLLNILLKFNHMTLTDELATEIMSEVIRYGLYRPKKQNESIKQKWNTTKLGEFAEYLLTADEVSYIIQNNPQNHKEAGFSSGYPTRFATYYDFAKELGFVYFNPGEPIEFSETGILMANIYKVEVYNDIISATEINPEYEQQVFLLAMSKSQRCNPFVRVLNDNIPLILLLQVIRKLNSDPTYNGAGISRKELPLLIFWKNKDAEALYQRIKRLRQEYGYNPSDETIIDICLIEIMEGKFKKFKPTSIMSEYPDEFIRKMRMTGLISLRGAGRFIDINHNENGKVEYVLEHYSDYRHYTTEPDYFYYISEIDEHLLNIQTFLPDASHSESLLNKWTKIYDWNNIKKELRILANKSTSKDEILKFIPAPARLEFLTALAIKSKLPNIRVIPNYPCDDEGLPTSTAGGDKGDIVCYENNKAILVEVTMATGRTQTMMEIWPIERHLMQLNNEQPDAMGYFIAPAVYQDSYRQIAYVRDTNHIYIKPHSIVEFLAVMDQTRQLHCSNPSNN